VNYLRVKYHLPIKIIPQIVGQRIDNRIVSKHIDKKGKHEKDKIFLLYDADVRCVLERLKKIDSATIAASNPSIEYWFFLHYKNQTATITEAKCIRELSNRNRIKYKKGIIDDKLKQKLDEKQRDAVCRAKNTKAYKNPSSSMFKLIEGLENVKS
jgi:hypothetical protein